MPHVHLGGASKRADSAPVESERSIVSKRCWPNENPTGRKLVGKLMMAI
jgi:hypothetical protein